MIDSVTSLLCTILIPIQQPKIASTFFVAEHATVVADMLKEIHSCANRAPTSW